MTFNPQLKQGMPDKKDKKPIKRNPIKKKRKRTGEKPLFEAIAESREWICFVTGEKLYQLKSTQFSHVLPKALNKYPLYKLYEPNIILLSDEAHRMWDFSPRSELMKDPRFDKLFELEAKLKAHYPNLTNL